MILSVTTNVQLGDSKPRASGDDPEGLRNALNTSL